MTTTLPKPCPVADGEIATQGVADGQAFARHDPEPDPFNTVLTLLTDGSYTLFELCSITALDLAQLADLLESQRMTSALDNMQRIMAVRRRALDIHKRFTADAALLNLAATIPLCHREAEPVRKAADKLAAHDRTQSHGPSVSPPDVTNHHATSPDNPRQTGAAPRGSSPAPADAIVPRTPPHNPPRSPPAPSAFWAFWAVDPRPPPTGCPDCAVRNKLDADDP